MVDFSVKSTGLSAPDLGAASHVSPGVEDKSAAMSSAADTFLLKSAGELGIEAYKGKQISDLNKSTQESIQEYMNRRGNPELAKANLSEAAATDVQSSLFKPTGEQLSEVERAQKERLATYQQALAEGVMSPDEFSDRVLANLRESTNKNPGLFQELKAEASRVLELSGITGIVKSDQLIAENRQKQLENMRKDLEERMKREHLYYDASTPIVSMQEQLQKAEGDTRLFDMQVRGKERLAMLSASQAKTWAETTGNQVVRGGLSNANKTALNMIDSLGITAENYPKFKAQITSEFDNLKRVFHDSIPVSIVQEPLVQQQIKDYNDGLDSIVKRFDTLASGDDMKRVLQNEVEILKGSQEKSLRQTYNVEEINLMSNMMRNIPGVIIESPVRDRYSGIITAIAGNNFKAPALQELVPKSDKDTTSGDILSGAINLGAASGDFTGFKRTLDAVNAQTPTITNPKTRMQFLYNNLSSIAKQKPLDLDVESISKVETSVGQLLNDSQFGIGTLAETSVGKKVQMDVLPSGHLIFTGEDASKFNATYANNVNIALRAYANAHNTNMAQAAKRFYPQYFGSIVKPSNGK